jgi:nitrogenase molybdenum-iron protein alpha/beta subunit
MQQPNENVQTMRRDFAANRAAIVVNGEDKHMVYVREFIKMVGVDPTLVSKLNSNDNFISGADRYHLLNLELEKARKTKSN